jgi:hypothetical protein
MAPMLEGLFLKPAPDRFVTLPDGRVLYLSRTPGAAVYLVPDEVTRARLARRFKVVDLIALSALGTGLLAAVGAGAWSFVPLILFVGVLLPRWMEGVAVESLPEAHDPDAIAAAARHAPGPIALPARLGALAFGVAMIGFALYARNVIEDIPGTVLWGALFFGLLTLFTMLEGWGDERPDEYAGARRLPPDDSPIEPRYF